MYYKIVYSTIICYTIIYYSLIPPVSDAAGA